MHRVLLGTLVAAFLVAVPGSQAAVEPFDAQLVLEPDTRPSMRIEGGANDGLSLVWSSEVPIDVFVVRGENSSAIDGPDAVFVVRLLNQTGGQVHATLPAEGPWSLVLDNTAGPAGGAPGTQPAEVTVDVAPYLLEVPPATGADGDDAAGHREPPTLWNTFLFDSWKWVPGGVVGFGGVALWALLVLAVACVGFSAPLRTTVEVALAATVFVTAWSLLPAPGAMTEIGLCALAGLLAAWFVVRRVGPTLDVLRVLLVATIVGAFAGDVLAFGLRHLWSDPGLLVFGDRRFVDEIFTVPGFAVTGFLLFKVVPELVNAQEGEDQAATMAARGPGQGDRFEVTCLRCRTEIKVDRSMKRFRVATDRFEFACPNCQYWMEWADPNAKGSAAA